MCSYVCSSNSLLYKDLQHNCTRAHVKFNTIYYKNYPPLQVILDIGGVYPLSMVQPYCNLRVHVCNSYLTSFPTTVYCCTRATNW